MKNFCLYLIISGISITVYSQKSFKLFLEESQFQPQEMVSIFAKETSLSVMGETLISLNTSQLSTGAISACVIGIGQNEAITRAFYLTNLSGNFKMSQSIIKSNFVYCIGLANNSQVIDSSHLVLIKIDLNRNEILWSKEYDSGIINSKQVIIALDNSIIISYIKINSDQTQNLNLLRISEDGDLLYKNNLAGLAEKNFEMNSICGIGSNKFYLCFTVHNPSDLNSDIYLVNSDVNANIIGSGILQIYTPSGEKINTFFKLKLNSNANNLYALIQGNEGRDRLGNIFISLIDENLILKTWRDYNPLMKVEDFNISPSRFLICGPRPISNLNSEGYAMLAINNQNAIPELLSNYVDGFENSSIATSSVIGSVDGRKYIFAAIPSQTISPYIAVASQIDSARNYCHNSLQHTVAKDRMTLTLMNDLNFKAISNSLGTNDYELKLIKFTPRVEDICKVNAVSDIDRKEIFFKSSLVDKVLKIEMIGHLDPENSRFCIFNSQGQIMPLHYQYSGNALFFDLKDLSCGLYFLSNHNGFVNKFILYN